MMGIIYFRRVLVMINLKEFLILGVYFIIYEDRVIWVIFFYEKIVKYCMKCGKVCYINLLMFFFNGNK